MQNKWDWIKLILIEIQWLELKILIVHMWQVL
jgi:hypothetical protein